MAKWNFDAVKKTAYRLGMSGVLGSTLVYSPGVIAAASISADKDSSQISITNGVEFAADVTLTINSGDNITSNGIDNKSGTANKGSVIFKGASSITGAIGATNPVKDLTLSGTNTQEVVLKTGEVKSETIHVNSGKLKLENNVTVTGSEGIQIGSGGTVDIDAGKNIIGAVTAVSSGVGTLTVIGASNIGQVGDKAAQLLQVTAGSGNVNFTGLNTKTLSFSGNNNIKVSGEVNADLISFNSQDGTLQITSGNNITVGNITTNGGVGKIDLQGNTTLTGNVGGSGTNQDLSELKAGVNGSSSVIIGDSFVKVVDMIGTGTLKLQGNLTGTELKFIGAGTVVVEDGNVITTEIKSSGGTKGVIQFSDNATVNGNLGTVANKLTQVDINSATSGIVTIQKDIHATTLNINSNAKLQVTKDITLESNTTVNSTAILDLASNTVTHTGNFELKPGTTLAISIAGQNKFGKLAITGTRTTGANDTSNLNLSVAVEAGSGYIKDGFKFSPLTSTVLGANSNIKLVQPSAHPLLSFASAVNGNNIEITVTRKPYGDIVGANKNTKSIGNVLGAVAVLAETATDKTLINLISGLDNATTVAEVNEKIKQLTPHENGSEQQGSFLAVDQALRANETRMDEIKVANMDYNKSGYSAGDYNNGDLYEDIYGASVWGKIIGNFAKQKKKDDIDGYNLTSKGFGFGSDVMLGEKNLVGLGFSMASTKTDSKVNEIGDSKITSYQATAYLSRMDNNFFIDGLIAVGYNRHENSRSISLGGTSSKLTGKFDILQPTIKFTTGYNFNQTHSYDMLTPMFSVLFSNLKDATYTEKGSNAALKRTIESTKKFEVSGGFKAATRLEGEHSTFIPEFKLMLQYDITASRQTSKSQFAIGGGSFTTEGAAPVKLSYKLGLGLTFFSKERMQVSVNYDYLLKEKYRSHYVDLSFRYLF